MSTVPVHSFPFHEGKGQGLGPSSASAPQVDPVRVLVVDDSAFMRHVISRGLEANPTIQVVGAARDGYEALEMIERLRPNVVTLDVEMPRMNGLTTLREIMSRPSLARIGARVVMLSSLTQEGASETIQALAMGAVDFVAKPGQKTQISEVLDEVVAKVLRAAQARSLPAAGYVDGQNRSVPESRSKPLKKTRPRMRHEPVVLIGASTGGPRALHTVVPMLQAALPAAFVIVQHMPSGFTQSLANRLESLSDLQVREVTPGAQLEVGMALLARGGSHLTFDAQGKAILNQGPTVHGVRPAVDVTLASLAEYTGRRTIAVILTGMGSDGTNGAALVRTAGGSVLVEAQSSCVVWGMPRSIEEAGLANHVVPLEQMASAISQAVNAAVRTGAERT